MLVLRSEAETSALVELGLRIATKGKGGSYIDRTTMSSSKAAKADPVRGTNCRQPIQRAMGTSVWSMLSPRRHPLCRLCAH